MNWLLILFLAVAPYAHADERNSSTSAGPAEVFPSPVVIEKKKEVVEPPKPIDPTRAGGNEVGGGGNDLDAKFVARGEIIVQAIRDYNRLNTQFPEALVSEENLRAFEESVKTTLVYTWEERPMYQGQPRDAGVFRDPKAGGRLSIAIYRQVFQNYVDNEINYDEIVLHEYGLVAELPDQFYLVTAPIVAKLKYHGVIPTYSRGKSRRDTDQAALPPGISRRPSTRVYIKTQGDVPPNAMAIFLGGVDSYRLGQALGPENLTVGFPETKNGKVGTFLVTVPTPEEYLKQNAILMNSYVAYRKDRKPRVGLVCGSTNEKVPSCVVWQWLWSDEMDTPEKLVWLPSYEINGKKQKYLRTEIQDVADSQMLYERLRVPEEPSIDDRFNPPRTSLRKAFYASDDSFSIDCFRYYGAFQSFSCVVESSLDSVTRVGPEVAGLASLAGKTYDTHLAKSEEIEGARDAVRTVVNQMRSEAARRAADTARIKEETMRKALGAYYASRPYSPTGNVRSAASRVYDAMTAEDFLNIAEAIRGSLP